MSAHGPKPIQTPAAARRPLFLTWVGLWAERGVYAFWPLMAVACVAAALALFGAFSLPAPVVVWALVGATIGAGCVALWQGLRVFRRPKRRDAVARLDASLPGRPLAALGDTPVIGQGDPASEALWRAHLTRMAMRVRGARRVPPDLRQSRRDPYALRYGAVVALVMALLFGSSGRMDDAGGTGTGAALARGPMWEGWLEPPRHTGLPVLYLNDIPAGRVDVSEGTRVTLRLYGGPDITLRESVSGAAPIAMAPGAVPPPDGSVSTEDFTVARAGEVEVIGTGGRLWQVALRPDTRPNVTPDGPLDVTALGEMALPFRAEDDYGVTAGQAMITLDLAAVDRRYGLALAPETRADILLDLPLNFRGARTAFTEVLRDDFSKHPWAQLPVKIVLQVEDAMGQTGQSRPMEVALPGRRFFDPVAKALIEARRDLLWTRDNGAGVAQVLRAISYRPEDVFRSQTSALRLEKVIERLEVRVSTDVFTSEMRDALAEDLWGIAIEVEEGDLQSALERMRRAQEQLSEAMRNGASAQEIARLMDELRDATQDYMRELAERDDAEGEDDDSQTGENEQALSQSDLQAMMDRIQQLMEEGRMAEAQQLLDQLMQLMENMRVTQGDQGGAGQEALDGLGETLREQQELSDESFNQLNEGQNDGPTDQGQPGQQGQGQAEGNGEGAGQDSANSGTPSGGQNPGDSGDLSDQLAQRQRDLANELARQRRGLPGAGTPEGDAARQSLEDAGRAMEGAEEALRNDDLGRAIDRQAEAIERLREGMRSLGEALTQDQQQQAGAQPGTGQPMGEGQENPLGRREGNGTPMGSEDNLLQGADVYRRAEELTEEIRRRSAETARPEVERDYLNRLLDRF